MGMGQLNVRNPAFETRMARCSKKYRTVIQQLKFGQPVHKESLSFIFHYGNIVSYFSPDVHIRVLDSYFIFLRNRRIESKFVLVDLLANTMVQNLS
jgi:hypothetical protein